MINKEETVVVAIDFQKKLLPAMIEADELEATVTKMIEGAKVLNLPIIVTQQYTKGLGETTDSITEALGNFTPIEKTTFSALQTPEFEKALVASGKKTVLILGIETHICVQQTAIELVEKGYNVVVIANCCSSRKKHDKRFSLQRMAQAGVIITTYEAVLFEMVGGAKNGGFKEVSKIIK